MSVLFIFFWVFLGATIGCIGMAFAIAAQHIDIKEQAYWKGFKDGAAER